MTGLHMIWYTFSHIMSWLQHLFSLMKQVVYPCIIPLGSNNQSFMKTVYVAMWPVSNTKCFMKKEYNGMWRVSSNKYFMKKWTYEYICIIMAWLQHLLYESQRERERWPTCPNQLQQVSGVACFCGVYLWTLLSTLVSSHGNSRRITYRLQSLLMNGFVLYLTEQYHGKETWKLCVIQQLQTVCSGVFPNMHTCTRVAYVYHRHWSSEWNYIHVCTFGGLGVLQHTVSMLYKRNNRLFLFGYNEFGKCFVFVFLTQN